MVEDQRSLDAARKELFSALGEMHPQLKETVDHVVNHTYEDGALTRKEKYLIALGIALGSGCRMCVLAQLTSALDAGASEQEIMDVLSVVFAMKGTTGTAESLRVVQYLRELRGHESFP
jgi:AhpD family alkylhydroperoxidase